MKKQLYCWNERRIFFHTLGLIILKIPRYINKYFFVVTLNNLRSNLNDYESDL